MLKSLVLTALITTATTLTMSTALACSGAKAQHDTPCKEGQCPHKAHGKNWAETLNLKGDKALQVQAIQAETRERKKALKQAHHTELQQLKAKQNEKLAQVLTQEEIAILNDKSKKECSHKKHNHKGDTHDGTQKCGNRKQAHPLEP